MAGFVLSEELDPLNFDFEPYVPGGKGTIPEPTNDQLETFQTDLRHLFPISDKGTLDVAALAARVAEEGEDSDIEGELYQTISDLTSGAVTVEMLRALPFRGQRAFAGWIIGKFASPEA